MGAIVNTAFLEYALRRNPDGLTKEAFYRFAEDVGWVYSDERRKWVGRYLDDCFEGDGEKEYTFILEKGVLRLKNQETGFGLFGPLDVHNMLHRFSQETVSRLRSGKRISDPLELAAAVANLYEETTGKRLYDLAVEDHQEHPHREPPRDPNEPKNIKHYEIEVRVSVVDDSGLRDYIGQVGSISEVLHDKLEELLAEVKELEAAGTDTTEKEKERWKWIELYRKFEDFEYRDKTALRFKLKGEKPPEEEAREKAVDSITIRYSTTDEQDRLLEQLGFSGFKLDRLHVNTEIDKIQNLSKVWLEAENELVKKMEGIE